MKTFWSSSPPTPIFQSSLNSPNCSAFQSSPHPTIPKITSLNENILISEAHLTQLQFSKSHQIHLTVQHSKAHLTQLFHLNFVSLYLIESWNDFLDRILDSAIVCAAPSNQIQNQKIRYSSWHKLQFGTAQKRRRRTAKKSRFVTKVVISAD